MRLYRLVLISLLLLVICFCTGSSTLQSLKNIEGYIQSDPQKAYLELSKVDRESLSRAEEQALYYLLYSMALDKNYIDIKADSLISHAVAYYSKRGDKLHKFYSYYYLGRIHANAREYDKALSAYVNAEKYIDDSIPVDYQARLFFYKSRVYLYSFAGDKALFNANKAKELSKELPNPAFFFACALSVSNLLFLAQQYEDAGEVLDEINEWMKERGVSPTVDYYRTCFRHSLVSDVGLDSIKAAFTLYEKACDNNGYDTDALLKADYYFRIGDLFSAKQAFSTVPAPAGSDYYEQVKYYYTKSNICKSSGDFEGYIAADRDYQRAVESIHLSVFNNDIRFLEERNRNSEERKHSITDILLLLVALIVALTVGGCTVWVQRRKLKENKRLLDEAREEYSFITNLFSKSEGNTPEAIKQVLDTRIKALRPYITTSKAPTQKGRKALETIDKDRREMLSSIGMLYALTYPKYTSSLADKGLSAEEIGLCSLYVCGYSSKEMLDLLNKGDIYHLNSGIRSKIGDEIGSRTLHSWLKDLFNQSQ